MLYLSRLITFLYIKQEIWGLAFVDTCVSLPFTPAAEPSKGEYTQMSAQSVGDVQHPGQPACPLPAAPTAPGAGGREETPGVREQGYGSPQCISLLPHGRVWPARAMQCQCSDNADCKRTQQQAQGKSSTQNIWREKMRGSGGRAVNIRNVLTEVQATVLVMRWKGNRKPPKPVIQMKEQRIDGLDMRRVR